MADTGTMKLLVNTPERVFFNGEATFVELATSEGEIGVYPQHIPLTAILRCRTVYRSGRPLCTAERDHSGLQGDPGRQA